MLSASLMAAAADGPLLRAQEGAVAELDNDSEEHEENCIDDVAIEPYIQDGRVISSCANENRDEAKRRARRPAGLCIDRRFDDEARVNIEEAIRLIQTELRGLNEEIADNTENALPRLTIVRAMDPMGTRRGSTEHRGRQVIICLATKNSSGQEITPSVRSIVHELIHAGDPRGRLIDHDEHNEEGSQRSVDAVCACQIAVTRTVTFTNYWRRLPQLDRSCEVPALQTLETCRAFRGASWLCREGLNWRRALRDR